MGEGSLDELLLDVAVEFRLFVFGVQPQDVADHIDAQHQHHRVEQGVDGLARCSLGHMRLSVRFFFVRLFGGRRQGFGAGMSGQDFFVEEILQRAVTGFQILTRRDLGFVVGVFDEEPRDVIDRLTVNQRLHQPGPCAQQGDERHHQEPAAMRRDQFVEVV